MIFSKIRIFSVRQFLDGTVCAVRVRNCRLVRAPVDGRAATARARPQDWRKIYGDSAGARTSCRIIKFIKILKPRRASTFGILKMWPTDASDDHVDGDDDSPGRHTGCYLHSREHIAAHAVRYGHIRQSPVTQCNDRELLDECDCVLQVGGSSCICLRNTLLTE